MVLKNHASSHIYIRGFTKFGIKVLLRLQFLEYLRTLSLKFQKARTKIEVVLILPVAAAELMVWLSCLLKIFRGNYSRKYDIQYLLIFF